jgi:hypothetical protein
MYYIAFLILLFFALREIYTGVVSMKVFRACFFLIAAMAILRYGQGTDYPGHWAIFKLIKSQIGPSGNLPQDWGKEAGYGYCNYLAIRMGWSYVLFTSVYTAFTMAIYYFFLKREFRGSVVAVFLFFVFTYMTYVFSAVRQATAMGIFLLWAYPLLKKERMSLMDYGWYYAVIAFSMLFHKSSCVLVLLPLARKVKIPLIMYIPIIVGSLCVSMLSVDLITHYLPQEIEDKAQGNAESSNSVASSLIRLFIILFFALLFNKDLEQDRLYVELRQYLLYGYVVYCMTKFNAGVCGRLWGYFPPFIYLMLGRILMNDYLRRKLRSYLTVFLIYACLNWFKDIGGYISQGRYENCNMFTYPYFSVFDSDQTVGHYRKSTFKLD